ncbi:MAG: LptF/LptG family permease [Candidatus Marinimicrobia bacterium]|nr:LptF/LptG family permease [Candidatus Neomarinimicrobiota bacterium]MCF7851131.1 LptF/LptG family permease [Candidatus Neomarinimicrobiota bacterium]MCF7904048.1 LptF/LptG family permease [Candidatus Neomarinimicrobiota bacterium]
MRVITLIDRYLVRSFFSIMGTTVLGLVGVFAIADFVEKIDNFVDAGAGGKIILIYYYYSIPYFIDMALPMSMLLATVFSLGRMNKHYEIAAMRASGISLLRISRSLIILGVLFTLFQFVFQNLVVMPFNHKHKEITRNVIKPKSGPRRLKEVVRQDLNGNIILIKSFDVRKSIGKDVSILAYRDSGITQRWDYASITWIDSSSSWSRSPGLKREFDAEGKLLFQRIDSSDDLPLTITPVDIKKEQIRPNEMNIFQLKEFIEKKKILGVNPHRWIVDYHFKIAFVMTGFIVILMGISFALQGTRENLALGVGKSVVALFGYYILLIGGQKIAYNSTMHPAIAVWFGDVFMLVLGIYLFRQTSKK